MSYDPTVWVDRNVEHENRYDLTWTGVGSEHVITPNAGVVTEEGTALTAARMNKIETGIVDASIAGEIKTFAMQTAPTGYLECDGSAVSRTTYANLFANIGTLYGTGDGSTTFNLPDCRGQFLRGWDNGAGVDSGRAFGSVQADDNKAHTHNASTGNAGAHTHTLNIPYWGTGGSSSTYRFESISLQTAQYPFSTQSAGDHTHSVTVSSTGTESRPKNIAFLVCIRH